MHQNYRKHIYIYIIILSNVLNVIYIEREKERSLYIYIKTLWKPSLYKYIQYGFYWNIGRVLILC